MHHKPIAYVNDALSENMFAKKFFFFLKGKKKRGNSGPNRTSFFSILMQDKVTTGSRPVFSNAPESDLYTNLIISLN